MSLKLGIHTGPQDLTMAELLRLWQRADEAGFHWASVWDHFYANPLESRSNPCFEGVASMAALAAATQRVRVGCLVFCALFRTPGLLAKAATTIDHISEGRAEIGVGAGWFEEEFRDFGYGFPPLGKRLDQLEEVLTIIRSLLRGEETTFKGKYYDIEGAVCAPRPHNPDLRLWVGGRGAKRTPRMAATYADGFNMPYLTPEEVADRLQTLQRECGERNRDPATIETSVNLGFYLSSSDKQPPAGLPDHIRAGSLVGGLQQTLDRIGEYEAAGVQGGEHCVSAPHRLGRLRALHRRSPSGVPLISESKTRRFRPTALNRGRAAACGVLSGLLLSCSTNSPEAVGRQGEELAVTGGAAVEGRAGACIVPHPAALTRTTQADESETFVLDSSTRISFAKDAKGIAAKEAARLASDLAAATGWQLEAVEARGAANAIHFALDSSFEVSASREAYRLEITGSHILLEGADGAGLFYAGKTLRQMLPPRLSASVQDQELENASVVLSPIAIEDTPRFRWRGMHLDVGRYLYDIKDIKRLLDAMAYYKFNVFHWHLTEDQGWRIEIKKYPRLTEVGAYRKSTPVRGDRTKDDGVRYGGYYTQDQIREVVQYAADRFIDVMPEIELPGHSTAAIAAYPQLGNPEFVEGIEVGYRWGVHPNTLNPQPETLAFYEDVFDEVLELFPFEFIHIGGDEAPKTQWQESAAAQARMRELGLANEEELQAWFVAHFEQYLAARGRRLVGWDEIHEGGLPAGATMMVWRGLEHGVEAARNGHDIIMAPTTHTYFDYYQGEPAEEPEAIAGFLPLEKVYSFEPIPEELTELEAQHVLGAQGQLWTEYMPDFAQVEYMAFPRLLALSEVLWTPKADRRWPRFLGCVTEQLEHLEARGIRYRRPDDL